MGSTSPNYMGRAGEPIAVIGSGCRFPGSSNSPSKLWQLLRDPCDLLTRVPKDRFNTDGFYHPDPMHHGTTNVTESYFLKEDHRVFDAGFFNIKGVEAHSIDPQQRLLMETIYESLETAGLSIESLTGSQTGVYVGLMCGDYSEHLQRDLNALPTYMPTGTARSIMSNRISYFFDWHGPCMTIDTACSSSLVAVHQAVQLLRSGESEIAVAAGSNLILGPELYIGESKLKMLSPGSRSRMWDVDADGYARGEGVAAVILKRLSTAIADGDNIECIIRESGVNQDGRTKGITMPSQTAQADLIVRTYEKAGLNPRDRSQRCQFFEAHGTGTPAGDPREAEAISTAFFGSGGRSPDKDDVLYVGSVKTVIGHTEGTAGIAGLLKASLAVQHGVIPPNLLFNTLSPAVEPFYNNLKIATSSQPWPEVPKGCPRRASVNSFGFGGTNAHVIVENFLLREPERILSGTQFTPFIFSAASEQALKGVLTSYAQHVHETPSINIQDLSYTLYARRSTLPVKVAFSASSPKVLVSKIEKCLEAASNNENPGTGVGLRSLTTPPRILGVFTGQGAQWATMGRQLLLKSQHVRNFVEELDDMLQKLPEPDRPSWSLVDEFLADASKSRVGEAIVAQPLCTVVQVILVDLLGSAGIKFHAVVGHSSGEIAAAYAAGLITRCDAVKIAYYRGLFTTLSSQDQHGAMMAVGTSMEDATELCNLPMFEGRLCVAAVNSSSSITLSGDLDAIEEAKVVFEEEKTFARILKVDKAYHSWHMIPCSAAYLKALHGCNIESCQPARVCSWFSSTYKNTKMGDQEELSGTYWKDNMVQPVLFSQAIEAATVQEGPFNIAIEIGPHPTLKGPVLQSLQDIGGQSIPYTGLLSRGMDDIEACAEALGYIWAQFNSSVVNFNGYDSFISGGENRLFLKSLPTYHWDHDKIFWHDSRASRSFRTRKQRPHPLLGSRVTNETDGEMRWRNLLRPNELPWLHGHRLQGQMVFPAVAYVATAVEATTFLADTHPIGLLEVLDFQLGKPLTFDEDDSGIEIVFTLSDISRENTKIVSAAFAYHACTNQESDSLMTLATGRVLLTLGETSADCLPPRSADLPNTVLVDEAQFYSSLESLGYEYTGVFRSLSSMRRKLNFGLAEVTVPTQDDSDDSLLIHPGFLDSGLQAIFLAYWWPNDGSLEQLHVPTNIQRICINVPLCQKDLVPGAKLPISSHLTENPLTTSTIRGDVDIFGADMRSKLIQIEGVKVVPFSEPSPDSDRQMFSEHVWGVLSPDCELAMGEDRATAEDYELATIMERVAIYYLKQLDATVPPEERDILKLEWHHECLFTFASHIISQVQNGKLPFAEKEWLNDTWEDISTEKAKFDDRVEMKLICVVGENLAASVRGETNMLQHLLADNLLNSFYVEAMGPKELTEFLAKTVAQVVHRYPHMKIVEIGAGTGGATKAITRHIGQTFSSYTFTDISTGFFETAQEVFSSLGDKMIFKALDIEKEITEQGYTEYSYDLVIGSLVLHATSDLQNTLNNTRRLLKPGGYLIILEITNNDVVRVGFSMSGLPGWWLGQDDGRKLSPCVSSAEWESLLIKSGFSKIDSLTPERDMLPRPMSVIVCQAIDERISILREPLHHPQSNIETGQWDAVIIGGKSTNTVTLIDKITPLLQSWDVPLTYIPSLDDVEYSQISPTSVVLNLTELDKPVFKDLTNETMNGLKMLFESQAAVLWITRGCRADEPFMGMSIGFGRSLVLEMPDLRLQFLDLDVSEEPNPRLLVESFLRLHLSGMWEKEGNFDDVLWTTEQELVCEKGRVMIPRLYFNQRLNDRFNASKRTIIENKNVQSLPLSLLSSPSGYSFAEDPSLSSGLYQTHHLASESDFFVKVSRSLMLPVAASGQGQIYGVLGIDTRNGEAVLGFSTSNGSCVAVQPERRVPYNLTKEKEVRLLSLLHLELSVDNVLSVCRHKSIILLYEPPRELAERLLQRALEKNLLLSFVTTKAEPLHDSWIAIHPMSSGRMVRASLPLGVSIFIDCSHESESKRLGSTIASCLPQACWRTTLNEIQALRQGVDLADQGLTQHLRKASDRALEQVYRESSITPPVVMTPGEFVQENDLSSAEPIVVDWSVTASVPLKMSTVDGQIRFAKHKTYVLFGLTSDLAQSICDWMVSHGARNLVLTSRNPKIDSKWIDQLKLAGTRLEVFSNDITDKVALTALVSKIRRTFPPIAGIAHGAMVLEDTSFFEMSHETMQKVLRPKVQGAIHLDDLFQEDTLDFFILFSSVAAVVGNRGQSAYSSANMFMTSMAFQRRRKGLAASILHIGAVVGVGYVTRELNEAHFQAVRKAGFMWMSERGFHLCLAEAILASQPRSDSNPEIVTGLNMITSHDKEPSPWTKFPRFQHCVHEDGSSKVKVNQRTATIPARIQLLEASTTEEIFEIVKDAFLAKLHLALQLPLDTAHSQLLSSSADDLGIDSLVAVEVRSWFLKELEIDMPVLKILSGGSVADLLSFAVEKLPAELTPKINTQSSTEPPLSEVELGKDQVIPAAPAGPSRSDTVTSKADESSGEEDQYSSVSSVSHESVKAIAKTPQINLRKVLPMSPGQSRFWFLKHFLDDQTTSNVTFSVQMKGSIRLNDLEKAIERIGDRHEALRTCFFTDEHQRPMQGVFAKSLLQLERVSIKDQSQVTQEFESLRNYVYNIEQGETMRVLHLSLTPSLSFLVIGYHHINMDGISLEVFLHDLEMAYTRQALPQPVYQYTDYSTKQRAELERGEMDDELRYWRSELANHPAPLPLLPFSSTKSRIPVEKYEHNIESRRIDLSLANQIREMCQEQKANLYHFYLAAFEVLLFKLLDTSDLCIGMADANRNDDKIAKSMGMYLNLLPLRFRLDASQTFADVLKDTRKKAYLAMTNSRLPFDILLEEIKTPRTTSHSPLFQAFINYRQGVREKRRFGDCETQGGDYALGRTAYDISIDILDNPGGETLVSFIVQKQLYSNNDAKKLVNMYFNLLKHLSASPKSHFDKASLFAAEDVSNAVRLGQGSNIANGWPETLVHRIDDIVGKEPTAIALKDASGNKWTYKQMATRSNQIAAALLSKNVVPGKIVALHQEPSPDWILSLLAIMRIGAIYVPLDLSIPSERLATMVETCEPFAILVHEATASKFGDLKPSDTTIIIDISTIPESEVETTQVSASARNPAAILFTSGTTGIPKGVILSHGGLRNHAEAVISTHKFGSETVLQQSALSFDLSLNQIFTALSNGGSLVIVPRYLRGDSVAISKLILDEKITYTSATPSEYLSWLQYGSKDLIRSNNWMFAVSGGEKYPPQLWKEFQKLGLERGHLLRLFNAYGPTEVSLSSNEIELSPETRPDQPIPAGYSLNNCSVYVLDDHSRPLPVGMPGEVCIGGAGVAIGYLGAEEEAREKFGRDPFASSFAVSQGWTRMYRTGDLGVLRDDGALEILGRVRGDTQIKLRGIRIEMEDIENTILRSADGALVEAVVTSRADPPVLVAHAVFSSTSVVKNQSEFLQHLAATLPLPQYMRPAVIIPINAMPLSAHGKIDRRAVESLQVTTSVGDSTPSRSLTAMEYQLRQIWEEVLPAQVLDIGNVGVDSDFFHVGGNSMLLIKLRELIRTNFAVTLSILHLFECSTLGAMAAAIQDSSGAKISEIDWESETNVPKELLASASHAGGEASLAPPRTVVLTGATGFLGKEILRQLVALPEIDKVHCIAVRSDVKLDAFLKAGKITIHTGDLALPRCGLSEEVSDSIFGKADVVIHNGADVSFLKTYQSLKPSNVESTKELVKLSLARRIPMHYVSTTALGRLTRSETFGEMSLAPYKPPPKFADGYAATKWASEVFLEKAHAQLGLPVWIHRPSSITGEGAGNLDVMSNMLKFGRMMKAVPDSSLWTGTLDFISLEHAAGGIVNEVVQNHGGLNSVPLKYLHHSGDVVIPIDGMRGVLEAESGTAFRVLPLLEWIDQAEEHGLNTLVAEYLRSFDGKQGMSVS